MRYHIMPEPGDSALLFEQLRNFTKSLKPVSGRDIKGANLGHALGIEWV